MRTKDDRDKAGIFDLPEPPKPKPMSADDFDWFGGFYEGLAVVHEDGDAYHVREDFTPAYSERYSAATHFKNGIAEVVTHANWVIRIRPDGTSIDHV